MMNNKAYYKYVEDVLAGNIVTCEYTKQACKRFNRLLNDERYEFKEDAVNKVINFCYKVTHSYNKNLQIELQPFQLFIFASIFGFYYKGTNDRLTHVAYIEMARKQGKSSLISLIALYCLLGDGEYKAEVDLLANSAKQAGILYNMAKEYCESIDPTGKYFTRYRDQIKFDKTKSKIQVLSSDTSKLDGLNPSLFIIDEFHANKNDEIYNIVRTGQASRRNPLGIMITTAGLNYNCFCHDYRKTVIDILYGLKEDDSIFGLIYTLDENDDYRDKNVWIKANPNLGVSVFPKYLEEQVKQAQNNSALEYNIMTKNFSIWSQTYNTWIEDGYIVKSMENVDWDFFVNKTTYVGVDLAAVSDLTAVSLLTIHEGKYYYKTKYYIPSSCLSNNYNQEKYKEWRSTKDIEVINGNCTDYDYIVGDFVKWRDMGVRFDVVSYDSWNSTQFAVNLTELGFNLTPYSQTLGSFNKPTKEFERLLKTNNIVLDKNPITRWCFNNATLKVDWNENSKPQKSGSENDKIDGVISIVEALGGYLNTPHYTALI